MALVACHECGKNVSTQAEACPHCGAPVLSAADMSAAGVQLRTVQLTSKRLKAHTLLSSLLFWGGLVFLLAAAGGGDANGSPALPALSMLIGIAWYVTTKVRIWWHHK